MQNFLTYCIGILLFSLPISMIPLEHSPSQKSKVAPEVLAYRESEQAAENTLNLYAVVLSDRAEEAESAATITQDDNESILNAKNIRIINLGPAVNYKGLDYAPTISADGKTLYYVSDRIGSKLKKDSDDPSHDFWAVKKANRYDTVFTKPYNIDTSVVLGELSVNTARNEGVASISADQQTIVFTGCERPDGIGDCDLYIAEIEGEKWGRPRNLGRNVNSDAWDSQPSISPDKSRIYFASNRPGAVGGSGDIDIWYTDYDAEFEEWKPAVNAGKTINTDGRDWSPFISADNQTLFFSSNGHLPNLGGTDFYFSRLENNKWSKPVNLGAPINTPEDEAFISLPASGDIVYFASKREDLPHFQGNYDIFMAFVPSFFRTVTVTGIVIDECSDENIPAYVTIKNPVTGKIKHDSLNTTNFKEFSIIISNTDFGRPEDSVNVIKLEITAENPTYGKVTEFVEVEKPRKTKSQEEAQQVIEIPQVVLKLGRKPKLAAEMDFADYIKENSDNPTLANFKGLVLHEIKTISLYPLLNYVFFDEGAGILPDRYILFKNPSETGSFTDSTIIGGTLEKYYNVLNIYGYRLRKYPETTLELVGCTDNTRPAEKRSGLSEERVQQVYDYLKSIWKIDESRMKITIRDLPKTPSNLKDSAGIQENRRVELLCDTWEVVKPILDTDPTLYPSPETMDFIMDNGIDNSIVASRRIEVKRAGGAWKTLREVGLTEKTYTWDWKSEAGEYPKSTGENTEAPYEARLIVTSKTGRECISDPVAIKVKQIKQTDWTRNTVEQKTLERYSLILFPFDKFDAGPLNERILNEYVFPRVFPTTDIEVVGHTDVVGLYDHNKRLSENRAKTVQQGINKTAKGQYATLLSRGVGEDDALYTNDLPEGRFYNRTVQVIIQTPLKDLK